MNTILITGVTGNIGSHVLYELLYEMHSKKKEAVIYLLIRKQASKSSTERLFDEVFTDQLIPEKIEPFYKSYISK